ncbi:MAG: F0F1 ATP synthase subunit epsilon [Acidobacteria bacterium]|nr:MAG: F0F1 ATP synthase subunit epsilon [Acidobacteriota bacterium]PYV70736.1 MAG: F0F1 ATP synthase subunit epsilon [Acidobacteriota bacterium]
MADTFQLEIVTPEKMVVRDSAEELQIPGRNGYVGILPHHAPLITELGAGEISYRSDGQTHRFSVAWGFAEVLPDRVTVLAETVERAGEINVSRAQDDLRQAEESLKSANTEEASAAANAKMSRAQARIEVAQKKT